MRSARGMRELALCAALALAWSLAGAEPAVAHAILLESTPAVDAVLPGPDLEISLHFNSRIDAGRSKLTLVPADGKERPIEVLAGDEGVLRGRATGLAPGAYRLRWQVLALDGHISRGDVPFRVAAP